MDVYCCCRRLIVRLYRNTRSKIQSGITELNEDERAVLDQWLNEASFTLVFQPSTAAQAVQRILCYYVFDKRMSQLQAIAEGMSEMNLRSDLYDIDILFPPEVQLTYSDVISGLVFEYTNEAEDKIVENFFKQFLDEIYNKTIDRLCLEDVLQFITGAPYFPSMTPATVRFMDLHESPLPRVHACSSELVLPTVHRTYEEFKRALITALEFGGVGFGLA